jgi:hypothetical protein
METTDRPRAAVGFFHAFSGSGEKSGRQAKAPAPRIRKFFTSNVGQALPPVNLTAWGQTNSIRASC